jgi:hypothetical protein
MTPPQFLTVLIEGHLPFPFKQFYLAKYDYKSGKLQHPHTTPAFIHIFENVFSTKLIFAFVLLCKTL